ncbi:hypothetical protein AXY43_16515 [Clostridium sp. MF28]|uniref:NYN domain-containing protein n=1 Tax=Clostridium TaxID=1485 RepID=UPI000D20BE64|nr:MULTISPECIES: hypothetical protein [Clostridium]AVK49454.1 hypothetical protein AXY43_16515 [Clostridium sp. MF28]
MEKITIDGTNVCWWYSQMVPKEISIKPLLSIIEAIIDNDDEFYCVFDASIYYDLKQSGKNDENNILSDLVNDFPDNFYIVTGSSRADGVVLHDAEFYDRRIISNDIYKDYVEKYLWLADRYSSRLIQGNLQRSGLLTVDKLKYGKLNLSEDIKEQGRIIKEKLSLKNSPEMIEVESEINKKRKVLNEINEKIQKENTNLESVLNQIKFIEDKIAVRKYAEEKCIEANDRLKEEQRVIQEKINSLNEQYIELEKKLNEAGFLVNSTQILKEKYETIAKLDEIIREKELETKRIDEENKSIHEKYKKYKFEVNEIEKNKREEELKLLDDKECIKKAQKAIGEFLEPYGIDNKRDRHSGQSLLKEEDFIHFDGSTWDVAVNVLNMSFLKHPICEECYQRNYYDFRNACGECGSKNVTKNPQKIWSIINSFAPKK